MKKTKIIFIVCIVIAVLLCLVPIPRTLKDGGTTYLSPVMPLYEIYIYNTATVDENEELAYLNGYRVCLFGIEICGNTHYGNE